LADTVRHGRPATPIEDDPAAFYVPLVEGTFTTMLRCATRADLKIRYSALSAPRVLDLGAGGAPWAIAILNACPDATAVVNDLEGVIDVARAKTAERGVADRCELRPGDFHRIDIEPGHYDLVVLGHVCRTEGADGARHLIARAFEALRPEGRLLLADYFPDMERKFNPHAVLMGTTMMASTTRGFTFTHQQFSEWLRDAGFEAIRLVEPIGFQQTFVATRPRNGGNAS
jgi:SAM-dependent methyltransferase